jgi:hypothetical protein
MSSEEQALSIEVHWVRDISLVAASITIDHKNAIPVVENDVFEAIP